MHSPAYLLASFVSIYVFFVSIFLAIFGCNNARQQQQSEIKALRFIYACNVR